MLHMAVSSFFVISTYTISVKLTTILLSEYSEVTAAAGIVPPSPFFWTYVSYSFLGIFGGFVFTILKLLRIPVSFETKVHANWKMCLVNSFSFFFWFVVIVDCS